MSLKAGIVGLPNVGKSTLFNALLSKQVADAANYPFCTIEPNVGVVEVPDERLAVLADVVHTQTLVPAAIEFVDIAGLVEGAHKGEGLGNKFLSHIREVDVIVMVLRDFADENVVRSGSTHPLADLKVLETELQLADLQQLERQARPNKQLSKEEKERYDAIDKVREQLNVGQNARNAALTDEELFAIRSFGLLTLKPVILVINTDEDKLTNESPTKIPTIRLCAKLEEQLVGLNRQEKMELLEAYGITTPGLDLLIKKTYETLGLITFLTAGEKEARAWPIENGLLAPAAAGTIHSDFEKAFIKAKVCTYSDFVEQKGWNGAKENGKVRLEGKDYVMQEGDVVEFMVGS